MSGHPFDALPDRGKEPTAKRHLDQWIAQAVTKTSIAERRLGWLVASSVVVGVLQRASYRDGLPRFLLKGGAYLEMRLGLRARSTSDVDTLFRGDFDELIDVLDECLAQPWGALELERSEVQILERVRSTAKPRRFQIRLKINGQVWRRIDVEVSADEGGAGDIAEVLAAAPLGHFGLPSAPELAGIALDYQVAQKLHTCTDPHQPPDQINDRARDIVDLVLLRAEFYAAGSGSSLRRASTSLFEARSREAVAVGAEPRAWPPLVVPHPHWAGDFARACAEAEIELDFEASVEEVNVWIDAIDRA